MPTYFVRLIHNREAVGLFSAEDEEQLADVVDELTDPSDCEYAELDEPGGILWGRGAKPLPLIHDWDHEKRSPFDVVGAYFLSEAWFGALTDEDLKFVPIFDQRDIPANDL